MPTVKRRNTGIDKNTKRRMCPFCKVRRLWPNKYACRTCLSRISNAIDDYYLVAACAPGGRKGSTKGGD